MADSILKSKNHALAIEIDKAVQVIQKEQKEYVLSKPILRSGTAIVVLISEAEFGQSKADFIHKMTHYLPFTVQPPIKGKKPYFLFMKFWKGPRP